MPLFQTAGNRQPELGHNGAFAAGRFLFGAKNWRRRRLLGLALGRIIALRPFLLVVTGLLHGRILFLKQDDVKGKICYNIFN